MNKPYALALDEESGSIWCATEGGALLFNPESSNYQTWTNSEDLLSNNLLSVAVSESGDVWFGSADYGISKYNPANENWVYYTSDLREGIAKVHTIEFFESEVWFGTDDAGAHILREGDDPLDYIDDEWEFYNTGLGLGDNTVRAIFMADNGDIWFGTNQGISIRSNESGEWRQITTENSTLRHDVVNDIARDELGRIWIATQYGLNRCQNELDYEPVAFSGPTRDVRAIAFLDNDAIVATNEYIYRYWYDDRQVISPSGWNSYDVLKDADGNFWFAIEDIGLVKWDPNTDEWTQFPINAPGLKSFFHVGVDKNQNVWTSTGLRPGNPDAVGINKLDPLTGIWDNFSRSNSNLPSNNATGIAIDSQNRKYIGNYNGPGGLTIISPDETEWTVFSPENSGLLHPANLDLLLDQEENLWMICWSSGISVLQIAGQDTNWYSFTRNEPNGGLSDPASAALSFAHYKGGLLLVYRRFDTVDYLDYGQTLGDKSDDQWHYLAQPSDMITWQDVAPLAVDKNDYLWIGSESGIARFSGQDIVNDWDNEEFWDDSIDLRGKIVRHILVDRDNNKWFSTNEGLSYFIEDKAEFVHFDRKNSYLPDDDVNWTAEDTSGDNVVIWVATNRGLARLEVIPDQQKPVSEVYAYPNPFNLTSGHQQINFYGIPENSEVNIYTAAGDLIKSWDLIFQTNDFNNNQIVWNVKNDYGERVVPGIYFFSVKSLNRPAMVNKFAILR